MQDFQELGSDCTVDLLSVMSSPMHAATASGGVYLRNGCCLFFLEAFRYPYISTCNSICDYKNFKNRKLS